MSIAGLVILSIGSFGVLSAVFCEWRSHEPKYRLMMKVFPWLMALGGVLIGIGRI